MGSMRRLLLWASGGLLVTTATLTCCVLPTLLVLIGAGSAVAAMIQAMPGLVAVSDHSSAIFVIAAALLTINTIQLRLARHAPCPRDPVLAQRCQQTRQLARRLHHSALTLYGTSLLITVVLPRLLWR